MTSVAIMSTLEQTITTSRMTMMTACARFSEAKRSVEGDDDCHPSLRMSIFQQLAIIN